jgi:hypothetical protein
MSLYECMDMRKKMDHMGDVIEKLGQQARAGIFDLFTRCTHRAAVHTQDRRRMAVRRLRHVRRRERAEVRALVGLRASDRNKRAQVYLRPHGIPAHG